VSATSRAARSQRLQEFANKRKVESDARYAAARGAVEGIPLGQPILVDHYSAKRHRSAIAKSDANMRKAIALDKEAAELERQSRAAAMNTNIYADDPEAIQKLEAKLAALQANQAEMIAINKLLRKKDREGIAALGFTEAEIEKFFKPDVFGGIGFASYSLSNNSATIRATRQRLEALKREAATIAEKPATESREYNGVTLVYNWELDRVQLVFPGRPDAAMVAKLKSRGFKWAPSQSAWQRQLTRNGADAAKEIAEGMGKL